MTDFDFDHPNTALELRPMRLDGPDVDKLRALNDEAFPPQERIPVEYLFRGLRGLDREVLGVYHDGAFIGFISMIVLGRCAYICYFAIVPQARSRGFGGHVLRLLVGHYPGRQIVVDFEAPDPNASNDAMRRRRREFYLRNGFLPTGYYQFYMDTEFEIACSSPEYDRAGYERLIKAIHDQVPDFDPHHYRKDGTD